MADTIPVTCPECEKSMQVPAKLAGKKIRCKGCEATILVKEPKAAKPAKPAPASPPPPSARPHDDDENADPYGSQKDDLDVPRCPFCAKELDPPDTLICLSCGYDLVQRRRHESKTIHAWTQGDYLKHLAPGVACALVAIGFVALIVLSILYMPDVFAEIGLQDDKEHAITRKKEFLFPPGACTLPFVVMSLFIIYKSGFFAIKRLFIKWRPPERKKEKK